MSKNLFFSCEELSSKVVFKLTPVLSFLYKTSCKPLSFSGTINSKYDFFLIIILLTILSVQIKSITSQENNIANNIITKTPTSISMVINQSN